MKSVIDLEYELDRVAKEIGDPNKEIIVRNLEPNPERLKTFILETANYPYFSTTYDKDMWLEDREWLVDLLGCKDNKTQTIIERLKEIVFKDE